MRHGRNCDENAHNDRPATLAASKTDPRISFCKRRQCTRGCRFVRLSHPAETMAAAIWVSPSDRWRIWSMERGMAEREGVVVARSSNEEVELTDGSANAVLPI